MKREHIHSPSVTRHTFFFLSFFGPLLKSDFFRDSGDTLKNDDDGFWRLKSDRRIRKEEGVAGTLTINLFFIFLPPCCLIIYVFSRRIRYQRSVCDKKKKWFHSSSPLQSLRFFTLSVKSVRPLVGLVRSILFARAFTGVAT